MCGFKCEFLKMRRNLCELGKLSSDIKILGSGKGGKNGGNITKKRNYAAKKHGIKTWYDPTWYDQNRWRGVTCRYISFFNGILRRAIMRDL